MKYNPFLHHRHSIRMKGYDYSNGGIYFITICVKDRICLFGDIVKGKLTLNNAGMMVENEWIKIPNRFPGVQLHQYVIMPNHFHAIMVKTVGDIVGAFKSIVTDEYINGVKNNGWTSFNGKLWQRNYYEHIIRDEISYHRISEYIENNPAKWQKDKFLK
jgi:putative transposase